MTVPAELAKIYASAPSGSMAWDCLSISHPRFRRTWNVTTRPKGLPGVVDENSLPIEYIQGPISVSPARQDGEGKHEMAIVIAAIPEVVRELVRAGVSAASPINVVYRQYVEGSTTPSGAPIILEATGVEVNPGANTVSLIAGMQDMVRTPFPSQVYRVDRFPGIARG